MDYSQWVLTEGFSLLLGLGVFFLLLVSRKEDEPKKEPKTEPVIEKTEPVVEVKSEREHWVLFVEEVTKCKYEDIAQHEKYESRFPPLLYSDFGDLRLSNKAISWGLDDIVSREMEDASLWVISKERDRGIGGETGLGYVKTEEHTGEET